MYREVSNIRFVKETDIKESNNKYKLDILPFNAKSTNAWKIYKKIIPSFPHFNNNHVTTLIRYINSPEEHLFLTCEETRWITTYDDISSKLSDWDYDKTTKEYKSIYMKYHKDFNNLELTDPRTFEDIKSETDEFIENLIKLNSNYNIDKRGGHIRISSGKAGFIKGHVEKYD